MVYISKSVTIRGGYAATNWATTCPLTQLMTLDAQGHGRVLYATGDIAVAVEGLGITGGDATGLGPQVRYDDDGGGYIYEAEIALHSREIVSNTASRTANGYGGGLQVEEGSATLANTTIGGNTTGEGGYGPGGGLHTFSSNLTLGSSTVYDNVAEAMGGGLCAFYGDTTMNNSTIDGIETTGTGSGGRLYFLYADAALSGDTISDNKSAFFGGGLYAENGERFVLTNNLVVDNHAAVAGSGLILYAATPRLFHNAIVGNSGGDGSGVRATSDFYGTPSSVTLTNTIIAGNTVGVFAFAGSTATLSPTL
jgi:hypothetical protein